MSGGRSAVPVGSWRGNLEEWRDGLCGLGLRMCRGDVRDGATGEDRRQDSQRVASRGFSGRQGQGAGVSNIPISKQAGVVGYGRSSSQCTRCNGPTSEMGSQTINQQGRSRGEETRRDEMSTRRGGKPGEEDDRRGRHGSFEGGR